MKKKYFVAVAASIVNMLFAVLSVALSVRIYGPFHRLELDPDIKLAAAEKLIKLAGFQVLPACAAVMILSALVFWLLRKQPEHCPPVSCERLNRL